MQGNLNLLNVHNYEVKFLGNIGDKRLIYGIKKTKRNPEEVIMATLRGLVVANVGTGKMVVVKEYC